jgi:adenylate cyclase
MKVRLLERGAEVKPLREIPVSQSEFLIGRGPDCELRLAFEDVSRHHCLIRITNDEATIEDLGSANGTLLNGQKVRSATALRSGDLLQVGESQFVVDLGDLGWSNLGASDPAAATVRREPKK